MKAREYLRFIICILGRRTTVMRGPSDNLKNPSPWSLNLAGQGASPWRPRSAALEGGISLEAKGMSGMKPGANGPVRCEVG